MEIPVRNTQHGCIIDIYASPRASKSRVVGLHGDRLKISVAAPPVDGKANEAIIDFFAEWLDVPKSRVTIVSGLASKQKSIEVCGIVASDVQLRLKEVLQFVK